MTQPETLSDEELTTVGILITACGERRTDRLWERIDPTKAALCRRCEKSER